MMPDRFTWQPGDVIITRRKRPLRESNDCHSPEDGRFCSGGGIGPLPSGFLEGSLFKGELYHASNTDLKSGLRPDVTGPDHEGEYGIFLATSRRALEIYGRHTYAVRVNIQRPKIIPEKFDAFDGRSVLRKAHADKLRSEGYDSVVVSPSGDIHKADEIIMLDPSRTWIISRDGKYF